MPQFLMLAALLASLGLGADDPGERALAAFADKCIQCHGPGLSRPKGKFGFVTDLKTLAESPRYVVPGSLTESFLWRQIDEGEMPPDEARAGPLTPQEKSAIRAWIEAGAPAPIATPNAGLGDPTTTSPGAPSGTGTAHPPPAPRRDFRRALEYVGRFHVLVIHFPIALLLTAAAGELWTMLRRSTVPTSAVRPCLWLGAISAVLAAVLGWLHAMEEQGTSLALLSLHRWIGTSAGAFAPVAAILAERDSRRGERTGITRGAILLGAAVVGVAAHYGGLLTYGSGYFNP